VQIRLATNEDLENILPLATEMFHRSQYAHLTFDRDKLFKVLEKAINKPAYFLGVAETSEGEITGFLFGQMEHFFFAKEPFAQNILFFVHPQSRGSSAASKLIVTFRKWAAKRGAHELVVGTGESEGQDLEKTDRFLRKMGLEPTGGHYVQRLARR